MEGNTSNIMTRLLQLLFVAGRLPPATCRLPPAACHLPPATCHLPSPAAGLAPTMGHPLPLGKSGLRPVAADHRPNYDDFDFISASFLLSRIKEPTDHRRVVRE